MHCSKHYVFHHDCADCKRKREEPSPTFNDLMGPAYVAVAAMEIGSSGSSTSDYSSSPSTDYSSSSSGFDSSTNSGGDFGGGGSGGSW